MTIAVDRLQARLGGSSTLSHQFVELGDADSVGSPVGIIADGRIDCACASVNCDIRLDAGCWTVPGSGSVQRLGS